MFSTPPMRAPPRTPPPSAPAPSPSLAARRPQHSALSPVTDPFADPFADSGADSSGNSVADPSPAPLTSLRSSTWGGPPSHTKEREFSASSSYTRTPTRPAPTPPRRKPPPLFSSSTGTPTRSTPSRPPLFSPTSSRSDRLDAGETPSSLPPSSTNLSSIRSTLMKQIELERELRKQGEQREMQHRLIETERLERQGETLDDIDESLEYLNWKNMEMLFLTLQKPGESVADHERNLSLFRSYRSIVENITDSTPYSQKGEVERTIEKMCRDGLAGVPPPWTRSLRGSMAHVNLETHEEIQFHPILPVLLRFFRYMWGRLRGLHPLPELLWKEGEPHIFPDLSSFLLHTVKKPERKAGSAEILGRIMHARETKGTSSSPSPKTPQAGPLPPSSRSPPSGKTSKSPPPSFGARREVSGSPSVSSSAATITAAKTTSTSPRGQPGSRSPREPMSPRSPQDSVPLSASGSAFLQRIRASSSSSSSSSSAQGSKAKPRLDPVDREMDGWGSPRSVQHGTAGNGGMGGGGGALGMTATEKAATPILRLLRRREDELRQQRQKEEEEKKRKGEMDDEGRDGEGLFDGGDGADAFLVRLDEASGETGEGGGAIPSFGSSSPGHSGGWETGPVSYGLEQLPEERVAEPVTVPPQGPPIGIETAFEVPSWETLDPMSVVRLPIRSLRDYGHFSLSQKVRFERIPAL